MTEVEDARQPPRWIPIVTGLLTMALVACAVADIAMQMSRLGEDSAETVAATPVQQVADVAPNPEPATAVAQALPTPAPTAVIATPCLPDSTDVLTADGSPAHCVPLLSTDTYLWSLYPGELSMPTAAGEDPAVAVCMEQTWRTEAECGEYLARPSNPGDGRA